MPRAESVTRISVLAVPPRTEISTWPPSGVSFTALLLQPGPSRW
jgi:hypothetical protein